ncbi:MAG: hypothetical protein LUG18_07420 [Candidatus Azobacteroides sp.]|nr:hypothetical protein [Candidatus Azobacteroides sp.]
MKCKIILFLLFLFAGTSIIHGKSVKEWTIPENVFSGEKSNWPGEASIPDGKEKSRIKEDNSIFRHSESYSLNITEDENPSLSAPPPGGGEPLKVPLGEKEIYFCILIGGSLLFLHLGNKKIKTGSGKYT